MDVDPRHGGSATLEILEMLYGPLPETEENKTPSGGRHLVFEGPHIFALGKHGLGQPREHDRAEAVSQEPVVEWDQPANIDWSKDYLVHDAPRSVAGEGGEQTTLDVATVLKDMAIS